MKQVYQDILLSLWLFVGGIFLIFMPPVMVVFTIIGFIGMIVALCLIVTTILVEVAKDD